MNNLNCTNSVDVELQKICHCFRIPGTYLSYEEIKVGNVNKTYKVNFLMDDDQRPGMTKEKSYMVQRINTYAFKEPVKVMDNIDKITEYMRAKDPARIVLHFHHTSDRRNYIEDEDGVWRLFNYVPSITYSTTDNLQVIYNAGLAFGDFQMILSDFDASLLYETIPGFHNTPKRYEQLEAAVKEDPLGRMVEVQEEVDWLLSVKDKACRLTQLQEEGKLPLRVTHNDTKINNVLFDKETDAALVVIDLDTVMPGLVGHDFGDAIRFAANFVEEDSKEPEKAGVSMEVFRAFTEGFLSKTAGSLTEEEIRTLPLSCFVLSCELATRFLSDYILGDVYFKTNYPGHNLVRSRCQIALAKDMLKKIPHMEQVVREFLDTRLAE